MPAELPTVAIPDLHNNLARLHLALTHAPPATHHLILLGDVIDHGPDARRLLTTIRAIHATHHLQLLAGNHEELMINALYGPPGRRHPPNAIPTDAPEWRKWLTHGGQATFDNYPSSTVLLNDAEWIRVNAKRWIVRHGWLYSHATRPTPDELQSSEHQRAQTTHDTLLWHRPRLSDDLPSLDPALIGSVHGHTPRTTPTELTGPDAKPAWFLDLGRHHRHFAVHHNDTGVHVLTPNTRPIGPSRLPVLARMKTSR